MKDLTIKEQVDVLQTTLRNQTKSGPSFAEFYDENWRKLDSLLKSIIDVTNKPKPDEDLDEELLERETRKTLEKIGLTISNGFEFDSVIHFEEVNGLSFEFEKIKNNKIKVKCKFYELDIYRSYRKYFDDKTYVDVGFNGDWQSMDVEVSSTIETTLENLADDLLPLISKVINLAKPFDTKGKFDNFELAK